MKIHQIWYHPDDSVVFASGARHLVLAYSFHPEEFPKGSQIWGMGTFGLIVETVSVQMSLLNAFNLRLKFPFGRPNLKETLELQKEISLYLEPLYNVATDDLILKGQIAKLQDALLIHEIYQGISDRLERFTSATIMTEQRDLQQQQATLEQQQNALSGALNFLTRWLIVLMTLTALSALSATLYTTEEEGFLLLFAMGFAASAVSLAIYVFVHGTKLKSSNFYSGLSRVGGRFTKLKKQVAAWLKKTFQKEEPYWEPCE